jgi:hypothetical protein
MSKLGAFTWNSALFLIAALITASGIVTGHGHYPFSKGKVAMPPYLARLVSLILTALFLYLAFLK